MLMAKIDQNRLREDIVHIVNVLDVSSRTGGYGSKKHMGMYAQFKRMVQKLEYPEAEQMCNFCWCQLLPETERTLYSCKCGRRLGYERPEIIPWESLL